MSSFTDPLRLEYLNGSGTGTWKLLVPFHYYLTEPGGENEYVVVPEGFITDFASIPRGLWNLLPPTGIYGKAAVIHDFLYQERTVNWLKDGYILGRNVDRGEADRILRDAMEVLGVGRFTRWAVYAGVRAGGWAAWGKHRADELV